MSNTQPMQIAPATLEGRRVRLEPLTLAHLDALWEVARDAELWRLIVTQIRSRDDLERYVATALDEQRRGVSVPFATVSLAEGRVVGSTRFGNIERAHRKAEIGWTWVGRPWQRSGINAEAKYLMLRHAFERWGCFRVELKTSAVNAQSRAAILRLGAVEEGILRSHMINEDGSRRDSVYFSILDTEWPAVKAGLEARMAKHAGGER